MAGSIAERQEGKRATSPAKVARDPILDDLLAEATGTALTLSTTGLKHVMKAGGVSKGRASRWTKEGRGNPLFDVTCIVYRLALAGQSAGAIVAHVYATLHHALMPISDADLVERFWRLMESESEKEGAENRSQSTYGRAGNLEELERMTLDEAGVQQELAACCRELRRRRIDPRKFA